MLSKRIKLWKSPSLSKHLPLPMIVKSSTREPHSPVGVPVEGAIDGVYVGENMTVGVPVNGLESAVGMSVKGLESAVGISVKGLESVVGMSVNGLNALADDGVGRLSFRVLLLMLSMSESATAWVPAKTKVVIRREKCPCFMLAVYLIMRREQGPVVLSSSSGGS